MKSGQLSISCYLYFSQPTLAMRNRFAPLSVCLTSGCCGVGGNTVPGYTSLQCGNGPVLEAVGRFELRLLVYSQHRTV